MIFKNLDKSFTRDDDLNAAIHSFFYKNLLILQKFASRTLTDFQAAFSKYLLLSLLLSYFYHTGN